MRAFGLDGRTGRVGAGPTVTTESGRGSPSAGRGRAEGRSADPRRAPGEGPARTRRRSRRAIPRAPHGPGDRGEVDRPEVGGDARPGRVSPAPPLLVHPDRAVALVVEDDRDRPWPSRGPRSRAPPSSSRSRRRRRPRRPPGPDGRARPRSPPAGRSPSRPRSGPRNVPGLRNRKWRASHRPKLPASVATIASSGRSRRSVAIAWPGWTPGPSQAVSSTRGRRLPRRPILGVDGAPGVDTRGVDHGRLEPRDRSPEERPGVGADA